MGFSIEHRAFDHGLALSHGGPVHGVALWKKGRAIDHQIHLGNKIVGVVLRNVFRNSANFDERIEFPQTALDRFISGFADMSVCHEELPVQIGRFEVTPVGNNQSADPCRGKLQRYRAANSSSPGNEDAGLLQFFLTGLAHSGSPHLPFVAGLFFFAQHDGLLSS